MVSILPAMSITAGGTLPQWLAAIFSGSVLAAVLTFITRWRGQSIGSDEKLRDHYAQEVARLSEKLVGQTATFREQMQTMENHYRQLLQDSDERHEACQQDRDKLRLEINEMHAEIAGLKRQIARYSSDNLVVLEGSDLKAPEATKSAKRVKRILRDEGDNL